MTRRKNQGTATEALIAGARATVERAKRQGSRLPASVAFERAAAGEEFTVTKPFKGDGKRYEKGETITLDPVADKWAIEHGYAVPVSHAAASVRAVALRKFFKDELSGREQRWLVARADEERATVALEALRRQLDLATETLSAAQGQREAVEAELRTSLERLQELAAN